MTEAAELVIVDTGVLVHVLRDDGLGKKICADNALRTRPEKPLISIVTVGEFLAFAKKRKWGGPRIERLKELLRQLVVVDINSADILERYADIDAWCQENGKTLGKNDLWIAATASVAKAHLLTADKDFDPLNGMFLTRTYYDPKGSYP